MLVKYVFNNVYNEVRINRQLKIKIFIILFRLSQLRMRSRFLSLLFFPIHVFYYLYSHFFVSIEIPARTKIGFPLLIWHGCGIVINPNSILGDNVVLRNGVVIGNDGVNEDCPRIHNGCSFGANAVVIGGVEIGENSKISPCSFVNYNVNKNAKVINCTIVK